MIERSLAIGLILLLGNWSSAIAAQPLSRRDRSQLGCEPIGRVVSNGDHRLAAGSLVCARDRLQPINRGFVEVLCYINPKNFLRLQGGVVSNKCKPEAKKVRPCTPQNRSFCDKPKGPEEEGNRPTLINPYSSSILSNRPELSWYPVKGATSYTVEVSGEGVNWRKTVVETQLLYPKEQPDFGFGNAYKVEIIANVGDSSISASTAVLNTLTQSEAEQIRTAVKQIKSLNLPEDEAAFDLDVVYRSQDLLTEAIGVLKARIQADSRNPIVYRVLGDRYLEVGLPDYAKREYTIATRLAQTANDVAELAKAQAGLKQAELYSQLPTRRNAAQ